jgi:hypothetical protein
MRRGPERCLGHADDRDAKLGMDMRAQTRPTVRIQVDIAIDHDEPEFVRRPDDCPQRRQFAEVESAWLIRCVHWHDRGPSAGNRRKSRVTRRYYRRPRTTVVQVMDIDGNEQHPGIRWRLGHGLSISMSARPSIYARRCLPIPFITIQVHY